MERKTFPCKSCNRWSECTVVCAEWREWFGDEWEKIRNAAGREVHREEQIIFEQIAEILSGQPAYKMANRTGLSRSKIRRMAQGIPFNLDYNVVFALGRLGYHLELVENGVGARWWPQKDSRI